MADGQSDLVEPRQEYLGFVCTNCQQTFAIIGPLDPEKMPPDQPLRIGAKGPLSAECSHCHHREEYGVDRLIRFST